MRSLIALLAMTAPALAHPGHAAAVHFHETDGLWVAGAAFLVATTLSIRAAMIHARAKA